MLDELKVKEESQELSSRSTWWRSWRGFRDKLEHARFGDCVAALPDWAMISWKVQLRS